MKDQGQVIRPIVIFYDFIWTLLKTEQKMDALKCIGTASCRLVANV